MSEACFAVTRLTDRVNAPVRAEARRPDASARGCGGLCARSRRAADPQAGEQYRASERRGRKLVLQQAQTSRLAINDHPYRDVGPAGPGERARTVLGVSGP